MYGLCLSKSQPTINKTFSTSYDEEEKQFTHAKKCLLCLNLFCNNQINIYLHIWTWPLLVPWNSIVFTHLSQVDYISIWADIYWSFDSVHHHKLKRREQVWIMVRSREPEQSQQWHPVRTTSDFKWISSCMLSCLNLILFLPKSAHHLNKSPFEDTKDLAI